MKWRRKQFYLVMLIVQVERDDARPFWLFGGA
jgi:hypothetical protein